MYFIVKPSEFNTSHTFTPGAIHNSTSVIDTIIITATVIARIGGTAHAAVKLVQLQTMQAIAAIHDTTILASVTRFQVVC